MHIPFASYLMFSSEFVPSWIRSVKELGVFPQLTRRYNKHYIFDEAFDQKLPTCSICLLPIYLGHQCQLV